MAQNVLDFMQCFGKFDKIVCWQPPHPPGGISANIHKSYGESWIRPCTDQMQKATTNSLVEFFPQCLFIVHYHWSKPGYSVVKKANV